MATATRPPAHFVYHRPADSVPGTLPEYLETDGLGGYALGCATGELTRRYHGWLVAARRDTAKRLHCLARFDERVSTAAGERVHMAPGRFAGVEPAADHFDRFELAPHPTLTFRSGQIALQRELQLVRGASCCVVRYTNVGDVAYQLDLRPLFTFRDEDSLTFENEVLDARVSALSSGMRFQPYAKLPPAFVGFDPAQVHLHVDPAWYKNVFFAADVARGYDGCEDQFSPCRLEMTLAPEESVCLTVRLGEQSDSPRDAWETSSAQRVRPVSAIERLAAKAQDFLYVDGAGRQGVLAGFPWFTEWGRDTFIALPGLTLCRADSERCRAALEGALAFLVDGLLPNIFGVDSATSHYGSADAALWFARAALALDRSGSERAFVQARLREPLESIIAAYERGTKLGLRLDSDGLLNAGDPERNPTWMDAQTSAGPVTPRDGAAVELNALWYQLVAFVAELRRDAGLETAHYDALREHCGRSFLKSFWLPRGRYLADRTKAGQADRCVRPNMILAAACELSPLSPRQRRDVVKRARRDLLTPLGLRTLATSDEAYRGRYRGGCDERDEAYHQGTVWPWLSGFYVEACLRAGLDGWRPALRELIATTLVELDRAGIDHVSEVFDGDAPQLPGGTIAQAWNSAELLRAHHLLEGGPLCAS